MSAKKLLVADDSLTIQKVIRLALSNEGYDIQAVSDGSDAIQQITLFRPDIVLIDVSLPSQSAFEVKRQINEHLDLSSIPFVLMSSAFEKMDETQIQEVHFDGQLTKPFDPAHLREVLNQLLAPHRQVPPPPPGPPPIDHIEGQETLDFEINSENNLSPSPNTIEDDWIISVKPDFPTIPPPPPQPQLKEEDLENLWEPPLEEPPPPPPQIGKESDIRQLTESTFRQVEEGETEWSVPPMPQFSMPEFSATSSINSLDIPPPPPETPSPGPLLSQAEIEALITQQVQAALEKMTKTFIPNLAEKLIKEEIHKLLSE